MVLIEVVDCTDPATGTPKQFSVTYGNWTYPGQWTFQVAVGIDTALTWNLTIPVVFPPIAPSTNGGFANYVKFRNDNRGGDLYPRVYAANGGQLLWDGRSAGFNIANGELPM